MTVFLNGHTITYEDPDTAIFDVQNGRKRISRLGKKIYSTYDSVQIKNNYIDEKEPDRVNQLESATNFNMHLKEIIHDEEVTTWTFEDTIIKRIIWTDEKPQNYKDGRGIRRAYDVSDGGNFTKYTDFSNVPETAILAYSPSANNDEIYLWTSSDKVKWPQNPEYMFGYFKALETIDFSKMVKTDEVTSIRSMFDQCYKLKNIDLTKIDISKLTDIRYAFQNCYELERIFVEKGDLTHITNDTYKQGVFNNCYRLQGGLGYKWGSKYTTTEKAVINKTNDTTKPYYQEYNNEIEGYFTYREENIGTRYLNIVGATSSALERGIIRQKDGDKKPGITDLGGLNALLIKNVKFEGYGGTGVNQDILFADTSTNSNMSENNLYLENIRISDGFVSNNDMFNIKNAYINDLDLSNITLKDDATGDYKDVFKFTKTQSPISYLKDVRLSYDNNTNISINSFIETDFTEGVVQRKFYMKDSELKNVNSNKTLIDLSKFTYSDHEYVGRGYSVYFDGINKITNAVVNKSYNLVNIVPRTTLLDDNGFLEVSNNKVMVDGGTGPYSV